MNYRHTALSIEDLMTRTDAYLVIMEINSEVGMTMKEHRTVRRQAYVTANYKIDVLPCTETRIAEPCRTDDAEQC